MGVDAIDETIYPSVLGMTKCSIAFGRWPHAIEHLVIPSTSGQIVSSMLASCNRTLGHSQHLRTNSFLYCIHTH